MVEKDGEFIPVKNENMVCKDCKHQLLSTAKCKVYKYCKPFSVLKGGVCSGYEKQK